jgi:hypothetical protein
MLFEVGAVAAVKGLEPGSEAAKYVTKHERFAGGGGVARGV